MNDEIKKGEDIVLDKRKQSNVENENKFGGVFDKLRESGIYQKLKNTKKMQIVAVAFIIAVALVIYSSVVAKGDEQAIATGVVASSQEARLSSILSSIDGAGEVEAMISEQNGEIVGVLVIAEGANNISVRVKLVDATSSALGVDRQIVNVYQKV